MGLILLIVLVLFLLGAWPTWPHSRNWGYYPSGGLGVLLARSEEHTSELQSLTNLVCPLLLGKKSGIHFPMDGLPWVTHSAKLLCWDSAAGGGSGRLRRFKGAGILLYHHSDHVCKPSGRATVVARLKNPQPYTM